MGCNSYARVKWEWPSVRLKEKRNMVSFFYYFVVENELIVTNSIYELILMLQKRVNSNKYLIKY